MSDPIKDWRESHAVSMYESLRQINPHLPDPEYVTAKGMKLKAGPREIPTLTIEIYISLPWVQPADD